MVSLYQAVSGINSLETLALGDSLIHRTNAVAKLISVIVYIVVIVSFPPQNVSGLIPFIFYPAIVIPLSGIPIKSILSRLLIAMPFPLIGGVSCLIFMQEPAFYIGGLTISTGMISFVSIVLKALLTISAVLILTATTSFIEISSQLSAIGIPRVLCMQLVMSYRYLSVLIDEAASMFTAYSLRSPKYSGIKMNDMGSFLGFLILGSFDRAERVYQAMKCRGFQNIYDMAKLSKLHISDWIYVALITVISLILRFINLSVFLGNLFG